MSVVEILYTTFNSPLKNKQYLYYLSELPASLQEKNHSYYRWQDKHAHLFGKLLLKEGLKRYGTDSNDLLRISYNEYGKPFLRNNTSFNISHSGEYVVCAIGSTAGLGVDIELIKAIEIESFKKLMSDCEWEAVIQSDNPITEFYKYWTIKESVIKALGLGLSIPLKDITIRSSTASYKKSLWNIKELFFDKRYSCHIAFNKPEIQVISKKIDFYID